MELEAIYKRFPTRSHCVLYLEEVYWNGVPQCPHCRARRATPRPDEQRHHCNSCNTSFSVTVRTVFHQSHISLQKWFLAVELVLDPKRHISARDLADTIQVNRNTAWRMMRRIHLAMKDPDQRRVLQTIVVMEGP